MNTKRLLPILEKELGPVTFGMFLRVARNSLELDQVSMAKKIGISRSTLCDIEKGRQSVSPALAVKIANRAGLSAELAVTACLQDQVNKVKLKKRVTLVA